MERNSRGGICSTINCFFGPSDQLSRIRMWLKSLTFRYYIYGDEFEGEYARWSTVSSAPVLSSQELECDWNHSLLGITYMERNSIGGICSMINCFFGPSAQLSRTRMWLKSLTFRYYIYGEEFERRNMLDDQLFLRPQCSALKELGSDSSHSHLSVLIYTHMDRNSRRSGST
jgi:hypothetical protein